jgi:hypothetical protein
MTIFSDNFRRMSMKDPWETRVNVISDAHGVRKTDYTATINAFCSITRYTEDT